MPTFADPKMLIAALSQGHPWHLDPYGQLRDQEAMMNFANRPLPKLFQEENAHDEINLVKPSKPVI